MAFEGEQQAVQRVGPAHAASGALNAWQATATSTTASAAIAIPGASNRSGCWVTLKPLTTDAYIVFGQSGVANPTTAADGPFFFGTTEDVWCPPGITHFKVISTGAGSLRWYRSSL